MAKNLQFFAGLPRFDCVKSRNDTWFKFRLPEQQFLQVPKDNIMHEKTAPQNLWGKIFEFRKDTKYEKTTNQLPLQSEILARPGGIEPPLPP